MVKKPEKEQLVPTRKLAEDLAKILGCTGSHKVGDAGWGPCESPTDLLKLMEVGNPAFTEWKKRQHERSSSSKALFRSPVPVRSVSFTEAKQDYMMSESFTPTEGMVVEAQRGLDWRREFGRGGTGVGIARARDIVNGRDLPYKTVKRMKAFFDRHQVDSQATGFRKGEKGYPSNGRIAWALWGGDAGYSWSKMVVERVERNAKSLEIVNNLGDNLATVGIAAVTHIVDDVDVVDYIVDNASDLSVKNAKAISRATNGVNVDTKSLIDRRSIRF